jgi:hypothetical protein
MKLRLFSFAILVPIFFGAASAEAQGRLFAATWIAPQLQGVERYQRGAVPEGPGVGGNIFELDPFTGAILNSFPPPVVSYNGEQGLAFDGTSLWYVAPPSGPEGAAMPLYELDPDTGAVIDVDGLPNLLTIDGLGCLGGLVYLLDHEADIVYIFDPAVDGITGSIDIGAQNAFADYVGGLDGWLDGNALLVTGDALAGMQEGGGPLPTHLLYVLDPVTGVEIDSFPLDGAFDTGVAALGDRFYAGEYSGATTIDVYDPAGALLDSFPVGFNIGALAAGGAGPALVGVPAISPAGAGALGLALILAAITALRRRRTSTVA